MDTNDWCMVHYITGLLSCCSKLFDTDGIIILNYFAKFNVEKTRIIACNLIKKVNVSFFSAD